MTQTRDLIKKMADFFKGEEFYEKGEDARLELSPDDVRCMSYLIQHSYKGIDELPSVTPQEPRKDYLSIDDVMLVFDDFMCGKVDEDGTETFLEMLKDKAETEET